MKSMIFIWSMSEKKHRDEKILKSKHLESEPVLADKRKYFYIDRYLIASLVIYHIFGIKRIKRLNHLPIAFAQYFHKNIPSELKVSIQFLYKLRKCSLTSDH